MNKVLMGKTKFGQFCFYLPNKIELSDTKNDNISKEELIKNINSYSQNNDWPSPPRSIELIQLKLTNKCNYSCIHCIESASPHNGDFININSLQELIKDFAEHNSDGTIVLTGGEPLLHPEINNIIQLILGFNLKIVLYTNGSLLLSDSFDESFLNYFTSIQLSIDGFSKEINDSIRGKGTFENALKSIKLLNKNNILTTISCTLSIINIKDIEDNLFSFIDEYYQDNITLNFDYIRPVGRGTKLAPTYEEALQYIVRVKKILDNYPTKIEIPELQHCGYGRSINLEANGNTFACTHKDSFLGNYPSFENILEKIDHEMSFMEERTNNICESCSLAWICSGGCFLEYRNSCDLINKEKALLKMSYGVIDN